VTKRLSRTKSLLRVQSLEQSHQHHINIRARHELCAFTGLSQISCLELQVSILPSSQTDTIQFRSSFCICSKLINRVRTSRIRLSVLSPLHLTQPVFHQDCPVNFSDCAHRDALSIPTPWPGAWRRRPVSPRRMRCLGVQTHSKHRLQYQVHGLTSKFPTCHARHK